MKKLKILFPVGPREKILEPNNYSCLADSASL